MEIKRKRMKMPNGYGSISKLSGKRRRPYCVRKSTGYRFEGDRIIHDRVIIGYTETMSQALALLADYNQSPYDPKLAKTTFREVYERWSKEHYPLVSESTIKGYRACYKCCSDILDRPMRDLNTFDLQRVIDQSGKNAPTLKRFKSLLNLMYKYALRYEIVDKDYSKLINTAKFKDKNPNRKEKKIFTQEELNTLWGYRDSPAAQICLMLVYSGVRIGELLNLKKENVYLDKHYFEVVEAKTDAGVRIVPIHDKTLEMFRKWMQNSPCDHLLFNDKGFPIKDQNFRKNYWLPLMTELGMDHTPHETRHTCISLLTASDVKPLLIKKIVGHKGKMDLTERVYTHIDLPELIEAVNRI